MREQNVFEEVEKEIKQMICEDKYIQIEINVEEMARFKKITEFEAKEIAESIVDRYFDNTFIKEQKNETQRHNKLKM